MLPDIDPGVYSFALDAGLRVNEHVFPPAISTANLISAIITKLLHLLIKSSNEFLVGTGNEAKLVIQQQIVDLPVLILNPVQCERDYGPSLS